MWEWSQQEFKKFRLISTKRNKRTEGLLADARVEVFTPSVSQCFQILVNRFQPFSTSPQPIQVYSEYIWIYPGSKTWFEHWFFFVVCFFCHRQPMIWRTLTFWPLLCQLSWVFVVNNDPGLTDPKCWVNIYFALPLAAQIQY